MPGQQGLKYCWPILYCFLTTLVAVLAKETIAPKSLIPDSLGPVNSSSHQSPHRQYLNLLLQYDDYTTVKTRPLLHLEAAGTNEQSPKLMIYSAYLDTRPLYYEKSAVLRVLALELEPIGKNWDERAPNGLYCKYLVEGVDQ